MAVVVQQVEASRIGVIADTHWRKKDGSDLSAELVEALRGVDLIVHLGDVGQDAALARLGEIAPVIAPRRSDGHVLECGGLRVGLVFDISKPDKAVTVDESGLALPDDVEGAITRRFGARVDAVAFGGTHRALEQEHAGVLFFNPGSPTLPSDKQSDADMGSIAVLDLSGDRPAVELVRLTKV